MCRKLKITRFISASSKISSKPNLLKTFLLVRPKECEGTQREAHTESQSNTSFTFPCEMNVG
jgi:hypothetical protein